MFQKPWFQPSPDSSRRCVRRWRTRASRLSLDVSSRTCWSPHTLTQARNLGERWGIELWLKREDVAHTGAHKINNAIGQALLAKRMGASRVIAETGAASTVWRRPQRARARGSPLVYMGAGTSSVRHPMSIG